MPSHRPLEPIEPEPGSFDVRAMARGEPGVPRRFRWRDRAYEVAEIERTWKELSHAPPCGGDRYVRRHVYAVRTTEGLSIRLVAERGARRGAPRWWIHGIDD